MAKILLKYSILVIIIYSGTNPAIGQTNDSHNKLNAESAEKVLGDFERGIQQSMIEEFFNHFANKIYLSFHNGISGSFSSNQSFFLIKDFLDEYAPTKFNLSKKKMDTEYPYGIGTLYYNKNGVRGILQVFVSLSINSSGWKISQITID